MRMISAAIVACLTLTACASDGDQRVGSTEFTPTPEAPGAPVDETYRIGPSDLLRLTVFQVEALSFEEIRVDAGGQLQLPVVGAIQAQGLTAEELARSIERRLGERYLRNPSVSVIVSEAASQKITVDGAVTKAGVYTMRGRTSLLQAIAMAEGATRTANLHSVAVFRTERGRRSVAVFDLAAIRAGSAADPVLMGDDVVVVDTSRLSAAMRDIIAALPALGVFGYYR
jgi:polysaccharide export outer membrane protein